jgi:hypothetical protein
MGVVHAVLTVIRHYDVRSPDFLIVSKVLWYAACVFIIYQLGKGESWARWVMVALFIASIPLAILPAFGELAHNMLDASITFLQTGLYIAALVLLFDRGSSAWFDGVKSRSD